MKEIRLIDGEYFLIGQDIEQFGEKVFMTGRDMVKLGDRAAAEKYVAGSEQLRGVCAR